MTDELHSAECSRILRVLADEDRLRIIQFLRTGAKSVSDICRAIEKPIANVSHHLGLLKDAGVVIAEKQGRFVIYHVNETMLAQGSQMLDFGVCRVEIGETKHAASAPDPQTADTLTRLNALFGRMPRHPLSPDGMAEPVVEGDVDSARLLHIANASFESPQTPFFDTAVDGWIKEGDVAGTGVFRNFPDDTPFPGSRFITNAHGEQLAAIGADASHANGPSALVQILQHVRYDSSCEYVLTVKIGMSSIQPPTSRGTEPSQLRMALFCAKDGDRIELAARTISTDEIKTFLRSGGHPDYDLAEFQLSTRNSPALPTERSGATLGVQFSTSVNTGTHSGTFVLDHVRIISRNTLIPV